eukprot:gnl/TRDRNA2_/TRDRNA2_203729_c0_seq1.p1 gnl/TRDRNA2_/TRDRNA2_203729_c0~~gnl/TRDRNA2_/TRDRNA2_203729_c0_seq1.p1  ORF type:complete len:186 (+),score=47.53 gnl/TRDRNA2_/TRDRNA2_203729_c0_seq1:61-618(+)
MRAGSCGSYSILLLVLLPAACFSTAFAQQFCTGEFIAAMSGEYMFNDADKNKDGGFDQEELGKMLEYMKTSPECEEGIRAAWKSYDGDGDGKVTQAEVFARNAAETDRCTKQAQSIPKIADTMDASKVAESFAKLDANADGHVTLDEMGKYAHEAGVSPECLFVVYGFMATGDKNKDGVWSKTEL